MPTLKFTKKAIEKLKAPDPSGKPVLYWDPTLRGFGLLVSGKTDTMTFVVQRKLPDGRTRRVTLGPLNVLKTVENARLEAEKVLAIFYRKEDPKAARRSGAHLTLKRATDEYLKLNKVISEKTRRGYRGQIEKYLREWLDLPIGDITTEMVTARHARIAAEVEVRSRAKADAAHKRALAAASKAPASERAALVRAAEERHAARLTRLEKGEAMANGVMRAFRAVRIAAAEGAPDLRANPVGMPRKAWFRVPRRKRMVPADRLRDFYAAVCALPSRTAADYVTLLLLTGLRLSEAAGLRWSEVDFTERVVRLPASRMKGGEKKLDLPMSDIVRDLLVARRTLGRENEFVFPADSRSGHISGPKFPLKEIAKATGITVSAHDLRRTFITIAEGTDMSPLALKALVNHSLGSDVTSGYIQVSTERLREPAQRVADRMKELCGIEEPAAVENVERLK
jgi:integrase